MSADKATRSGAASSSHPASSSPTANVLREFGVIHLRNALTVEEQAQIFDLIAADCKTRPPSNPIPANFHISSGAVGAKQRKQPLHDFGEQLYARFASAVASELSQDEVDAEPALARIARVHSGQQPVHVDHVSGVCYLAHSTLDNHQDGPMPLNTMSLALGDACDFVVGQSPAAAGRKPFANLRAGTPVTLRMESGDAVFFDGVSVPHAVPRIHKGTAPDYFKRLQQQGFKGARVSILFREPDGWDAKFLGT